MLVTMVVFSLVLRKQISGLSVTVFGCSLFLLIFTHIVLPRCVFESDCVLDILLKS